MALITGGRVSRFLQKYLGVKGEPVMSDLADELQPSINVLDLPIELRILDSVRSYVQRNIQVANASHATLQLQNPVNSGVVVVLEHAIIVSDATLDLVLQMTLGSNLIVGGLVRGSTRDLRGATPGGSRFTSSGQVATSVAAVAGGSFVGIPRIVSVPAVATVVYETVDEIALMPGDTMGFEASLNLSQLQGHWWWRERALEPSELTA